MANRKKLTDTYVGNLKTDKRIEIYDDTKGAGGLVLRVTPTGHKSFAFRYWYHDQSKQFTIGKYGVWDLADARKEVKELKKLIGKGIDPIQRKQQERQARPMTFGEVLERYKADKLPELKESTRVDRQRRLKVIEKGLGAKKYVKNMKRGDIIGFLDTVKRKAPVNAQKLQVALSAVFRFAKDREWVTDNIASGITIKPPQGRKTEWVNVAYTDDEIRRLWAIFEAHTEPIGSFFKFLLVTGQRSGETRLAKWKDIDFDSQFWTIPGENTKNGLTHYVPLSDISLDIFEKLRPWNETYVFESLVNPGNPIYHPSRPAQRIKKDTEAEGRIDFNAHSLRTTFATRQAGMGTPPQILSKLLNHKKGAGSEITALYDRYDYDEEKRLAMNKWNNELMRIITGKPAKIHRMGS